MKSWFKTQVVAIVAVLITLGTLSTYALQASITDSVNYDSRITLLEETMEELRPVVSDFRMTKVALDVIGKDLRQMKNSDLRYARSLEEFGNRTARLETEYAVTNQILRELTGAVRQLSSTTKELTKVVTTVAVLDEKVTALREDVNRIK